MTMEDVRKRYDELEKKIKETNPTANIERIRSAFELALSAHGDQKRKDGSPYITHPLAAAEIIVEMGLDEDSIIAALLHDCIEDTEVTHEDVARLFGNKIAEIVEGVTKLDLVVNATQEEAQMENLRKMLLAMAKDIRVIMIKMADRLHNMRTMTYQSEAKRRTKALETMQIYAPIAHRLGMQRIKWELEDLSLLYLDPVGYKEIEDGLKKKQEESQKFVDTIQENITKRLNEVGIKSTVYGRVKHIYSIYRKMYTQNKLLDEIMDLFAFRVIVDDIAECYNVLGYIHEMYKPIPGHFKDYIGTPKPNMYQSLHTTVIGSEGIPFEVQIRTWEMHHTAEYGIAAHWKYKAGIQGKTDDEEKFAWIRRLLESQQDSDAQDFFRTLKMDMFADEVFVFTPNADVRSLPAGATPIDFAYSIHSEIGNKMTGAKVNGRIVPFNHVLQNGDIVEIITSNASKGPSRDWLNIVVSSEARNKIRQWFKKERKEENIAHGKLSFDSELKRSGLTLADISKDEFMQPLLKRMNYQTIDDLYAAIGYGGMSAHKVVTRFKEELRQYAKAAQKENAKLNPQVGFVSKTKASKPIHGIVVEGVDNCLVKFAKCCTPVPGDDIAGFITRGYGVSIHRKSCKNYNKTRDENNESVRWINVSWGDTNGELYPTSLEIMCRDRDGLVMDIATVINGLKIKLDAISTRSTNEGRISVYITIQVHSLEELNSAINKIMSVRGVSEIKRNEG